MREFTIRTNKHAEFLEITDKLQEAVDESGIKEGVCVAVVPHTTAGITINENADPDVVSDMIYALDKAVPWNDPHYRHSEGNTAAHIKSSMMGHSVQVIVRGEKVDRVTGMLADFTELKRLLREISEPLDHVFLNDIEPFTVVNPSAENIAVYICEKMQAGLSQGNPVEVAEVKVWETDIQSATYRPPSTLSTR